MRGVVVVAGRFSVASALVRFQAPHPKFKGGGIFTGTDALVTALTTAFTNVGDRMTSSLEAIAPIALTVMGGYLVIRFGVRIFRSITGR